MDKHIRDIARTTTADLSLETVLDDPDLGRSLEWLKQVAEVDDSYLRRWSTVEWRQWHLAMIADREGPCPGVPSWMQPLMPEWHQDFSLPRPCVAQLWPTSHDWFTEADRRADFSLVVESPEGGWAPHLEALAAAWSVATSQGLQPQLAMSVLPTVANSSGRAELVGVIGVIEGFYLAVSPADLNIRRGLEALLGREGTSPVGPLTTEPVLAWEWVYG